LEHDGPFNRGKRRKTVLDRVSFSMEEGETLAVVGESGSGKTTLGRCLLRLNSFDSGKIFFNGVDLSALSGKDFRNFRKRFQMVFQNPSLSLNPRQTVKSCLEEVVGANGKVPKGQATGTLANLLRTVDLPEAVLARLPGSLSGGQKQRVALARALAVQPVFLIADEITSSLDAGLKWQIVELLQNLKREFNLTVLFITHDLSLAAFIADRVAVMKEGSIVETGPIGQILANPQHPYTRLLIESAEEILSETSSDFALQSLANARGVEHGFSQPFQL